MKRLYDFKCPDGHVTEHYVDNETRNTECQKCPNLATRILSPVLAKLDMSFPGHSFSWERKRESKMKAERKQGLTPYGQPDQ